MVDEQGEDDDAAWTEEDERYHRHITELGERFPTFVLLFKALSRHRRYKRLVELRAPQQILDKEIELRGKAFDDLADAFPFDAQGNLYHLPDLLSTIVNELNHPHEKGGTDA